MATKVEKTGSGSAVRLIGILLMLAGLIMVVAGATTWFTVQSQLADERITVSADAEWFAGEKIDGPLTAYSEAQIIEKHALKASGGKTYAELDKEDPVRATVMTGSFLRASLFTSVVSFGIAAMAAGLGLVIGLIGYALFLVARRLAVDPAPTA
ncbi:aromatic ring-opening dioxygenase LigA [Actinoplanes sp. NPDC049802]|uniref:aromatic ring-opening dioxygenase LigA n=1 Tax=Actinoplanes sp. NPDC049802 TaxID=3154742 RepID=UPI0033DDF0AA